jgi:N-methylhydantoinase B
MDAITLEILRNQLESTSEEMGNVLINGAFSPNIKERQDCSTALFDSDGRMIAQAEHIPVHLGAMPDAVDTVRMRDPGPGDVFVLNDPFEGGTHLPDITIIAPVHLENRLVAYTVSRAHHGDVGGMTPGSMPAGAREIYQEGLRLPPVRLISNGRINTDVMDLLLANVRNPVERRADLQAQIGANRRGAERLGALRQEHGLDLLLEAFEAVIDYSRRRMNEAIRELPDGVYKASDVLEGDGLTTDPIEIKTLVTIDGDRMHVDFSGTADQVPGNVNAPLAVARSAVYFVVRCITDPDIPPNQGCYDPITIDAPQGCLLNPRPPAAVVGGNVETSQRITDVVFAALARAAPDRIPAQSQGTMNNVTIGSRTGQAFTYYETIGGGMGARPTKDGIDGVQIGMTNTLNTPIESLEAEYPIRVNEYSLRPNSGGAGRFRGGLGIERTLTVEEDATVSLLTERREVAPRGLAGGGTGARGQNLIDDREVPAKITRDIPAGTRITVRTPGGGGHGDPRHRSREAQSRDTADGKITGLG